MDRTKALGGQALLRMQQNLLNLFARNVRKPLEELAHSIAPFQVLKQRNHRNPRPLEQPHPAHLAGHTLNSLAKVPIKRSKEYAPTSIGKNATPHRAAFLLVF